MSWPACGLIASCSGSKPVEASTGCPALSAYVPTKYTVVRGLPFCDFAAKYIPHGFMGCGDRQGNCCRCGSDTNMSEYQLLVLAAAGVGA